VAKKDETRQIIATFSSLGGYIFAFLLLGVWLDRRFFNNDGKAVVISVLVGIIFVVIGVIRLVKSSSDSE